MQKQYFDLICCRKEYYCFKLLYKHKVLIQKFCKQKILIECVIQTFIFGLGKYSKIKFRLNPVCKHKNYIQNI